MSQPQVTALLCEYATILADGTCTIVRGGIEVWKAATLPLEISPWLFVQVGGNSLSGGKHEALVQFINPEGLVLHTTSVELLVGKPEFPGRFTLPLRASVQAYGDFTVRIQIEALPVTELRLNVKIDAP